MIEGKALVQAGIRPQIAHICARCVETCDGIFQQHQRKTTPLERVPTPRELVARVKATVRQLNAADCAEVAAAALELEGGQAVRHLLEQRHLEPSSLRPRTDR